MLRHAKTSKQLQKSKDTKGQLHKCTRTHQDSLITRRTLEDSFKNAQCTGGQLHKCARTHQDSHTTRRTLEDNLATVRTLEDSFTNALGHTKTAQPGGHWRTASQL